MTNLPRILIIAGSDSSGGAGIQADIKTATILGGYVMTAITALTAQNTTGVQAVQAVPPDFVALQMRACIEDIGVDAVKTGMLLTTEIIEAVAATLPPALPLILDPVMVATSGAALLEDDAVAAMIKHLFPLATLITPNIPETERLSGHTIHRREDMEHAATILASLAPQAAILVKGGHLPGDTVHDLLWQNGRAQWFTSPRIATRHTHGTGCTLASAIATLIARGLPLAEAVETARDYVHQAIAAAPGFGSGSGPLNHLHLLSHH